MILKKVTSVLDDTQRVGSTKICWKLIHKDLTADSCPYRMLFTEYRHSNKQAVPVYILCGSRDNIMKHSEFNLGSLLNTQAETGMWILNTEERSMLRTRSHKIKGTRTGERTLIVRRGPGTYASPGYMSKMQWHREGASWASTKKTNARN